MDVEQPFGFQVRRDYEWYRGERRYVEPEAWSVFLPHQCDEWTVIGEPGYKAGAPRADAAAELARFIAEAEAALAALRAGEEFGEGRSIK